MTTLLEQFRSQLKGLSTAQLVELLAQLKGRATTLDEQINLVQERIDLQQSVQRARIGLVGEGGREYSN